MKMASHKAIGASSAVFMGFDIVGIITVALGSILPDVIDMLIAGGSDWTFARVHRTISHWWPVYVGTLLASVFEYFPILWGINISLYVYYLSIGCLTHLICDMLTKGGIPFLNPFKQSLGLRLFSTGSPIEYLVVAGITVFFLYNSYLSGDSLSAALRSLW